METILEVKKLKKKIGKTEVLHDISFSVFENEIVGFVGPNGAGKSTTMKCITGLFKVPKDMVYIMGKDMYDHHVEALQYLGASIEAPALFPDLNGYDHFSMVANWRKEKKENLQELYELSGLKKEALKRPVRTYSMGMKQRLMLSLTLIGSPKLLLLDEPLNGLDPQATFEFREKLLDLKKRNTSILLSSHQLNEVEKICDRIVFIKDGRIVNSITTEALQQMQYYTFQLQPIEKARQVCKKMNLEIREEGTHVSIRFDTPQILNAFFKAVVSENIDIIEVNSADHLEQYYKNLYRNAEK